MSTDNSAELLASRHALAAVRTQKDGPAFPPQGARHSPLRRLFHRNKVATGHRCLAMHMYLAGPHSALEE